MAILPGRRLGPYEILSAIGAGGMGEVYKARDTRLDRIVAIKVLPAHLADRADLRERFDREAKTIASLNHPHICTLYDTGHQDGIDFLVMEYLEGETLAQRLQKGALPTQQTLQYAIEISDALDKAHRNGVTHRDLKPGNIMLTKSGTKLLDFGLAKLKQEASPTNVPLSDLPTAKDPLTAQGILLGTLQYMAPEQVEGKEIDARTDIFAFGAVVYEMATSKRAFEGKTQASLIAKILEVDPLPISSLQPMTPPALDRVVKKCLAKEPENRWQTPKDLCDELKWIEDGDSQDGTPARVAAPSKTLARFLSAVVAIAFVAALFLTLLFFRQSPPEVPVVRANILSPDNTTLDFTNGLGLPALSPDGKRIVFGARSADGKTPLWVRSLDALTAQPLAGTEGAAFPFWSPDSRFIAFFADGKLKKIDASGGPALTLADAPVGRGGSWSRDGVIIFAPVNALGALLRVSSAGGASSPINAAQGRMPWFLPDGRHFLYQTQPGIVTILNQSANITILVGSLDGGESKPVTEAGSNALYAQGYLLFLREGTLMTQPFDPKRLVTTGEAAPVAEQIQRVLNTGTVGVFSVSEMGMLTYRSGAGFGGLHLTWFDRSGKQGVTVGEPADIFAFNFSPDRKSLAAAIQETSNVSVNIWTYDVSRGLRTRLTFDPANDNNPVWSPDGRSIVFRSNRKGHFDLYRKSANGAGSEELLYADNLEKSPTSWSTDGKFLLYLTGVVRSAFVGAGGDLWALPLTPQRPGEPLKPFLLSQGPFNAFDAQFSPDSRWIAYVSNESQRAEIYVTPFPPLASGVGGKRQVSAAGGILPRWRQDGKEIFYMGPDGQLMAAEIEAKGGGLEVGQVRPLFRAIGVMQSNPLYDVSADGQHFLLRTYPEQKSGDPLTLVQNWTAGLKK
jgi:serine/threonine protein kinase/dipeptidyl aminopeptidase/acylaminoacyl peptidase